MLIGGFGFIGMHLISTLSASHDLIVFSRKQLEDRDSRFQWVREPVVEIGDIIDGERVKEVMLKHRPEAVVHLAAMTGGKKCEEDQSLAFSVNVFGTYNVIMECVTLTSRLIFLSSKDVYGDTISDQSREDDPLIPKNVYGLTKMLGERLVEWAGKMYNLDYTILRPTFVYGPGGDEYNIQFMLRNALKKKKIRILGGTQKLDLLYVKDLAEVIRRCLILTKASKQVLNVGSGEEFSVNEVARKIISSLKIKIELEKKPLPSWHSFKFRPSLQLLEKTLGYRPTTTFEEGLQKTIEWYGHTLVS